MIYAQVSEATEATKRQTEATLAKTLESFEWQSIGFHRARRRRRRQRLHKTQVAATRILAIVSLSNLTSLFLAAV